ncbi:MAG: helix-turn-helix transcriptional regulator [Clostridia bacterium]|nr:helix-turn-helix transcriptional regulator [Clostridia bacterium]
MEYTKRLYDLRIDNDLKQEDIAKILQITPQAYGMYENKKRGLPIESLITLCKFYNVSADYILGLSDDINLK